MKEGFEASNCCFNEEIRLFGSILELECMHMHIMRVGFKGSVTPHSRGSVDYPSTCRIQVDIGLPDTTSENRAEAPLYVELYLNTLPA